VKEICGFQIQGMNRKILHTFGYVLCLGLFVAAIFILHKELKHYRYHDIILTIRQMPARWLILAAVLTFADYFLLTFYDRLALFYLNRKIPYPRVALASFIGYVFNHNMTFLGGGTARYRLYSVLSVPTYEIAKLILFCSITFWLGVVTLGGTTFVLNPPSLPESIQLPLASLRTIGGVFLGLSAGYVLLVSLRHKSLRISGWDFERPSAPVAAAQVILGVSDLFLASMVLYVLLPAGHRPEYGTFLGVYLFAIVAGLISSVPGGLGVFDTVILLLLKPLVPPPAILGALMLYRVIYYLVPFGLATILLGLHETILQQERLKKFGSLAGKLTSAVAPQILALSVALAGVVLLFSGALPAVRGRLHILRNFLPLPAIELSHFLGSLVGAALLMLARSIQRRVNAAYPIAIFLLCCGIVLSLLKGLDYEEASVLAIILLVFLPCRHQFYRKAALLTRRFTPGWTVLVVAVLLCSVWLGLFVHRHVEYSHQLWWQFALHSDAPRFLRATAGAAVFALLFSLAELLKPAAFKQKTADPVLLQTVNNIVAASPKTYANLALLGDKQFLLSSSNTAFLMYAVEGRSWVVMGDPVGSESEWDTLLWDFRELCDQHGGWPVFYQIDKTCLDKYLDLGLSFLKLGEEACVSLTDFSLEGSERRDLRYAYRKMQKENISFSVIPSGDVPDVMNKLKSVSDRWLAEKKGTEKGFSLGYFNPDYIRRFPVAVVSQGPDVIAFANLWLGAEKQEMSVDLMRYLPTCPNGIMDFLFTELMLWGKAQGYQYFSLGMAPLSGMENHPFAPLWQKAGSILFRYGEHFYNFQGLRKYKEKFSPEWSPKYLACPRGLVLPRILTSITLLISAGGKKL
jgi:phosphatidylglycerol lysyltransferase